MRLMRPLLLSLAMVAMTACNPSDGSAVKTDKSNDTAQSGDLSKAQDLVTGASHGQMRATKLFDGPDGLRGILTEPSAGGIKQIVWASHGLQFLIPGDALDKNGQPQNAKYMADQKVYTAPSDLSVQLASRGFVVGKTGPVITVFMDPNCIFCNKLYKEVMPHVKEGKLRARFVMVGFLKPTSIPRAVSIVSAKNPASALEKDEMDFDEAHEEGGAPTPTNLDPAAEQEVRANTEMMNKAGATGTPAILACQKGQTDPTLLSGMPQDFPGFLESLDPSGSSPSCK